MANRPRDSDASTLPVERRLLDAALAELIEVGASQVSLRSIARRAGISHQAVRHHFRDRAALFSALAAEGFATLGQQMEAAAQAAHEPAHRVAAMGGAYIDFAGRHQTMFALMFGSPLIDPADSDLVRQRVQVSQEFAAQVQAAVSSGWGHPLDAETLAVAAWSLAHGMAHLNESGLLVLPHGLSAADVLTRLLDAIASKTEGQVRRARTT